MEFLYFLKNLRMNHYLKPLQIGHNIGVHKALREKEKGDWHKLTKEEKKALYRASFCQTLVEVQAPTGYWKSIVGSCFIVFSLSIWLMMALRQFVYDPLPYSFSLEHRQAQLQYMLDAEVDIVDGLSSKYDYEKETWKK